MGIFSRLTDIINSNINGLLDRAEEPEKLIRLVIQEMEDTLVEVRTSTVRTIAEKKELDRRIADLNRDAEEWRRKAELALSRDREDLARGALIARAKATEALEVLVRERAHVEEALAKTSDDIAKLQAKLADAKAREKAIVMRQKSAETRLKVRSKLYDERITDAFTRFEQIERNLDELEGRVESYDIGRKKPLAEEIADLEANDQVDRELAQMKARLAGKADGGSPERS